MFSEMGFTPAHIRKAFVQTVSLRLDPQSVFDLEPDPTPPPQNGDAEAALEWLFSNPSTGDDEEEPVDAASGVASPSVGGRSDLPARYRLKAFISHKGPSVHSGYVLSRSLTTGINRGTVHSCVSPSTSHYVATIESSSGGEAALFNDEKVARSSGESHDSLKALAYLYVFERV